MNIDRANDSAANLSLFMVNVAYYLRPTGVSVHPTTVSST